MRRGAKQNGSLKNKRAERKSREKKPGVSLFRGRTAGVRNAQELSITTDEFWKRPKEFFPFFSKNPHRLYMDSATQTLLPAAVIEVVARRLSGAGRPQAAPPRFYSTVLDFFGVYGKARFYFMPSLSHALFYTAFSLLYESLKLPTALIKAMYSAKLSGQAHSGFSELSYAFNAGRAGSSGEDATKDAAVKKNSSERENQPLAAVRDSAEGLTFSFGSSSVSPASAADLLAYAKDLLKKAYADTGVKKVHVFAQQGADFGHFRQLCHDFNLEYTALPAPLDYEQIDRMLEKDASGLKILVVNWVDRYTGKIANLEKLSEIADKRDVVFVLNGAWGAGIIPIDLSKYKIDLFIFAGYKMYGPPSTAGVIVTDPHIRWRAPRYLDAANIAGLDAALDFLTTIDRDRIINEHMDLVAYTIEKFEKRDGIEPLGGTGLDRAGIFTFSVDDISSFKELVKLNQLDLRIESKKSRVRLSFGVYSTRDDVDEAFSVIDDYLSKFGF